MTKIKIEDLEQATEVLKDEAEKIIGGKGTSKVIEFQDGEDFISKFEIDSVVSGPIPGKIHSGNSGGNDINKLIPQLK